MEIKNDKKQNFSLLFSYSALFFITAIGCFFYFPLFKKSFFRYDGIVQHCTALAYWGNYLREFIFNIFHGKFILPQWDFSIGFGADIIQTLHYYAIGEPLNLLSVFFKSNNTEYLYTALIFTRLFLAGLAFIFYSRHCGFDFFSTICGSIVYVFCGYVFFVAPRHPFFIASMIYLPLMCIGIDFIFEKRNSLLFSVSIFVSAISSYYFLYMNTIIVFIYALVHYYFYFNSNEKNLKHFILIVLKTIFFYIIGILLSAAIFFPNVVGFLCSSRASDATALELFYDSIYYFKSFLSLIAPPQNFSYTFLGFSAPVLPIIILLFFEKDNTAKEIKFFLVIIFILLFSPLFARLFNGFNYPTNRWSYAIAFPVSISVSFILPKLYKFYKLEKKKVITVYFISLFYCFSVFIMSILSSKIKINYFMSYLFLLIFLLISYIFYKKRWNSKYFLIVSIVFGTIVNAFVRYSPSFLGYINEFFEEKSFSNSLNQNVYKNQILQNHNESDFFRFDTENERFTNLHTLFNIPSTSYYWSQNNSVLKDFYDDFALATGTGLTCSGLNNRKILQNILCVDKSFILSNEMSFIPYNSSYQKTITPAYESYFTIKNYDKFPFAIAYNYGISENLYKKLTPLEKQSSLVQCASIPNYITNIGRIENVEACIEKIPIKITCEDGIKIENKIIKVTNDDSVIFIDFSSIKNKETYLYLNNIFNQKEKNEKTKIFVSTDNKYEQNSEISVNRNNLLFNFGFSPKIKRQVSIRFERKGTYSFEDIGVYSLDIPVLQQHIDNLKKSSPYEILFNTNSISLKTNFEANKILCLSIPFSPGWTAKINGKQVKTFKTQSMLTGLFLEQGDNFIEMKYRSPFLKVGFLCSVIGIILTFCVTLHNRLNNSKNTDETL